MAGQSVEDSILVAAFASSVRSSTWLTLQLAAQEVRSEQLSGPSQPSPPVIVVLCDDGPETIDDATTHLVADLGVRAIVASFDDTTRAGAVAGVSDRAFLLSPDGALGEPLTQQYWHLGGDHRAVVPIYADLFDGLARSYALRTTPDQPPYHIAFVLGTLEDKALASLIQAVLMFDGANAGELAVQDRLRSFHLSEDAAETERTISDLIRFAPDLILAFTSGSFSSASRHERAAVIGRIEEARAASSDWAPLYIIGPRRAGDSYLESLARADASFRSRAIMIDVGLPGQSERAALGARFAERYPRADSHREAASPAPRIYDAFYYLFYAEAAARRLGALEPMQLGVALSHITDPSGPAVRVGPGSEGLTLGAGLLRAGSAFALQGITGAGPFDVASQTRDTVPATYCWRADGAPVPWPYAAPAFSDQEGDNDTCGSELMDAVLD
jgi:hypothetical protein